MDNHIGNFVMDEGVNAYGIQTQVRFEGDQIVKVQSYDAQPILEQCAADRIATDGQRWGEMRKVGTIPPVEYAKVLAIKDAQERRRYIRNWLLANQKFLSFEKYAR